MVPVTSPELRADWMDNPTLTAEDRETLGRLPDSALNDALREAFRPYEDRYMEILDEVRGTATRALLEKQGAQA